MHSRTSSSRRSACLLFMLLLAYGSTSLADAEDDAFSMEISDVFKITGRGVVMTGRIASGVIEVGGIVCVPLASGKTVARTVDGIEQFREVLESARAGDSVGLLVADIDHKEVERGATLDADCEPGPEADPDAGNAID